MGEIRIVGPGKTRGYPYPVCKKKSFISIQSAVSISNSSVSKYPFISKNIV